MRIRPLVLFASVILLLFCVAGCKGCKARKLRRLQAQALYTSQHFSDFTIDSSYVIREVGRDSTLVPFAEEILEFYARRNYQAAWLNEGALTISAYDFLNTLRSYKNDFGDKSLSSGMEDGEVGELLFSGSAQKKALLDLKLTATFFRYADRAYGGAEVDLRDLEWYIPRMKKNYQGLIDSLVTSPASYSIYEPVNPYYKSLKKVLVQYRDLEKTGGLVNVSAPTLPLKKDDKDDAVAALKKSLHRTGDYTDKDMTDVYTDPLTAAVSRYQRRLGLRPTGIVDSATLAEINMPIGTRISQIMLNMERLRWMPDANPSNYILVNIPEYRLHVYEHDSVLWSMDVVVGNSATATSIFTGKLSVVDFGPYWNVPQSIIKNELLPKLKQNPGYLSKLNMEVVSNGNVLNGAGINWNKYTNSVPFIIRQKPGPENSLGLIAFFFPNSFDIFLHDTPAKSFFNESSRAFSHGCIRLAEPERLADYLFRNDSVDMSKEHIRELMDAHVERKVAVKPSVPVYIVYFTAWVDQNGEVNFRHDIYGHDAKLAKEVFGK